MKFGPISARGPVFVRVPSGGAAIPYLAVDKVNQNERLALELDLEGDAPRLEATDVEFEIAATADGPALVRTRPRCHGPRAKVRPSPRLWPTCASSRPGRTFVRAKVAIGDRIDRRTAAQDHGHGGTRAVAEAPPTSAIGFHEQAQRRDIDYAAAGLRRAAVHDGTGARTTSAQCHFSIVSRRDRMQPRQQCKQVLDKRANLWALRTRGLRRGGEGTGGRIRQRADAP